VKSGGHALNQGWSSTAGVQIAMSRFNNTSYDPATKVATIGTGQKWETVYAALAPHNVSVAGGRIADVGVGGFTLGGGYSWFANQIGLSIDTAVEFELVTPTGSILTVNNSTNTDLFFGLKVCNITYGLASY
jgi:FAD/FMN-containing dehydrogenase